MFASLLLNVICVLQSKYCWLGWEEIALIREGVGTGGQLPPKYVR